MKHFIHIILLGTFLSFILLGCTNNESIETTKSSDIEETIISEITALNPNSRKTSMWKKSEKDQNNEEETKELKDEKAEKATMIAVKDACGAFKWASLGICLGVPAPATAFGALAGAIWESVDEYCNQKDENKKQNETLPYVDNGEYEPIDLRNPTTTISLTNDFLAGDFGELHNLFINLLIENTQFCSLKTEEEKINYILNLLNEHITELPEVMQYEPKDFEDILNYDTHFDISSTLSGRIFMEFTNQVANIKDIEKEQYAYNVMSIINNHYVDGDISQTDAYIINSAISTYINSFYLWRTFVPSQDLATSFIVKCNNYDYWLFVQSTDELLDIANNHDIQYVGIPKITNQKITEVFFFEDIQESMDQYEINVEVLPNGPIEMDVVPFSPSCEIELPQANTYEPNHIQSYPNIFYIAL